MRCTVKSLHFLCAKSQHVCIPNDPFYVLLSISAKMTTVVCDPAKIPLLLARCDNCPTLKNIVKLKGEMKDEDRTKAEECGIKIIEFEDLEVCQLRPWFYIHGSLWVWAVVTWIKMYISYLHDNPNKLMMFSTENGERKQAWKEGNGWIMELCE